MRNLLTILAILTSHLCFSQELDIYQNDSIYSKSKITIRTMYSINGGKLQKELVTHYNQTGQITKQFSYWNGDQTFHNVETFLYSKDGLITQLVDSFTDGNIETTNYYYKNGNLEKRLTTNQNHDTCDFRSYPNKTTTIQRWYMDGKAYRYDTTIFEKENIKLEYYGTQNSQSWHYRFLNEFDPRGNLVKTTSNLEKPYKSFTRYVYDKRNLLTKKQEIFYVKKKEVISTEYYFTYE